MEVVTGTRKEAFKVRGKKMLTNWIWGSSWGDGCCKADGEGIQVFD